MDQGALRRSKRPLLCNRWWPRGVQCCAGHEMAIHQDRVPPWSPSQVPWPRLAHSADLVIEQRWLTDDCCRFCFLLWPPPPMDGAIVWGNCKQIRDVVGKEHVVLPRSFTTHHSSSSQEAGGNADAAMLVRSSFSHGVIVSVRNWGYEICGDKILQFCLANI